MAELMAEYSPADARAGEEAEDEIALEVPGEGRRGCGREVEQQRHREELLAAEPVGQVAEQQCAQHGTAEIGGGREADLGIGEAEARLVFENARHGPGQRHFQPVQHPCDAERHDDEPVPTAPGQAVEASGNVGFSPAGRRIGHDALQFGRGGHPAFSNSAAVSARRSLAILGTLDDKTRELMPAQLLSPESLPYSILGQRFITTCSPAASARAAAASLRTVSCIQMTRGSGTSAQGLVDDGTRGVAVAEDVHHVDRLPGCRPNGRKPADPGGCLRRARD